MKLIPLRDGVIDALTGKPMPKAGADRQILLPPDHAAIRSGDIKVQETPKQIEVTQPPADQEPKRKNKE